MTERPGAKATLAIWREMIGRSFRMAPWVASALMFLLVVDVVSFVAVGLALREIVDGTGRADATAIAVGAVGAALAYALQLVAGSLAGSAHTTLVEYVAITQIQPETLEIATGIETLEHLERPEFLNRLDIVRAEPYAVINSAWSSIEAVSLVTRLALSLAVLGSVSPYLLGLLVFAAAPLGLEQIGRPRIQRAETAAAEARRVERHLFSLATTASSSKEIRVAGVAEELVERQRVAWNEWLRIRTRARFAAAGWSATGWLVFGVGFLGALALVVMTSGTAGDLVLAITVGAQLRFAVETAVRSTSAVGGAGRVIGPLLWLRGHRAAAAGTGPALPAPTALRDGITLDGVSFGYPAEDTTSQRLAVADVSVRLPAGSVVAVVGEYGSGKTTLVKLLAKFYRPTAGAIRVDGVDLADLDTASWRSRLSAAFQDFGRYLTTMSESIGLGDVERAGDPAAIARAVADADAQVLVDKLPQGLDTELGRQFGGVELSEGQWQKVALARASMRQRPVLFLLDEPTASLDAPSENAIFERYMARARASAAATGAVTLIVSHRFSTVAGADLILVMDAGRLVEVGDHDTLLALGGRYADLYGLQADAYAAG
ncbi:ABC transporter ATP-binding protein [Luedemannella helvata]|uniref:ABC transporter ATP-binding protein n=1 Tax=Luedemannella helvata TaxID=349315 RepID=A0ABP4WLM4_9ACTN